MKKTLYILMLIILSSCGSQVPIKKTPSYKNLLANALAANNFSQVAAYKNQVGLSNSNYRIIDLYESVQNGNTVSLNQSLVRRPLLNGSLNTAQLNLLNNIKSWHFLKQIYRQEISPPVRILQRDQLYLSPSHINFNKCPRLVTACAIQERKQLLGILTNEEITIKLKAMAINDPCANLTQALKGEAQANRCLRKSKGNLKVDLINKPQLSAEQWMQVLGN